MQTHIDYENELNEAQYQAVNSLNGPVLVIAGAGSGKTRTIVYRLARLIESGVSASSILLLTFTRKAAREMIERGKQLFFPGQACASLPPESASHIAAVQGGTFHAYAYSVLRVFQPSGLGGPLTVMDGHDIIAALQHCREKEQIGRGDKSFPKNQTVNGLLSKSRNKEIPLEEILRRESPHLLPHATGIADLSAAYSAFKRSKGLLDYDDLLFELERLFCENPEALQQCRRRHSHIMVDEYQDTNPVQARLASFLAGLDPHSPPDSQGEQAFFPGNIMAVGDDAQSIYAFRGADVQNILRFPQAFPGTQLIRLEENYRSSQAILQVCNAVLEHSSEAYPKNLFSRIKTGPKPKLIHTLSDRSQAILLASSIMEKLDRMEAHEIAVLFRAGFHSYPLELELNKRGVTFQKYGGIRYSEAAHIKDLLSFLRLIQNPLDYTAFARLAQMSKGVGAKTCQKIYEQLLSCGQSALAASLRRFPELAADLAFIEEQRARQSAPALLCEETLFHYQPRLESLYPDDYPRRIQGLEQFIRLAANYTELDLFIADLSLEDPQEEERQDSGLVLSTIHSAKGLEWRAVLLLDLVEERFPSRHSLLRQDEYEEERRLMYVACTRAKEELELYVPGSIYDRSSGGTIPSAPSPFVRELSPLLYDAWHERYTGGLMQNTSSSGAGAGIFTRNPEKQFPNTLKSQAFCQQNPSADENLEKETIYYAGSGGKTTAKPEQCGYCHHKIFGRGKIIQHLEPDKYRVNFPGFGLKVIMAAYLSLEEGP